MYPNNNIDNILSAWNWDPKPGHRKFANWLVENLNPTTIVDLGVDLGYSSFCFAEVGIGHVYGIDTFEHGTMTGPRDNDEFRRIYMQGAKDPEEFVNKFKKDNFIDNVTFIKGYFSDVLKTWDKKIDILHIDGMHTYDAVKEDYETWSKWVDPFGVVLFHDTVTFADVRRFVNEIPLPKLNFPTSHGLGVVSRNTELLDKIVVNFPYVNKGPII